MFGGEPLSYTRFSLARQPDGDSSQVEMKLSAEDEEGGENGVINHLHTQSVKPSCSNRHLLCRLLVVVLLFLTGFLIGYLSSRGRMQVASQNGMCSVSESRIQSTLCPKAWEDLSEVPAPEPVLYWDDLKKKLSDFLNTADFLKNIRKLSETSHEAGSAGDESLAHYIYEQFNKFKLDKVWNDEHYVRLQSPGSPSNEVSIETSSGIEALEKPNAYVAYSGRKTVSGKPVYANYGREDDFSYLVNKAIPTKAVILVKAGKITFAEKVANAQKWGAVGVLIYPDPSDYDGLGERVSLFGHAHLGTGDPFTPGFPSFNHTQFPPDNSSGLPSIPVQTISSSAARRIFSLMDGEDCETSWKGSFPVYKLTSSSRIRVKLQVNNTLVEKKLLNVFGVIQGIEEADRYVVIGAQRDSWGPGTVKSGVGTSLLLELAQTLSSMVKTGGYKPRRSIVFASWSAGDFGAVGATEWLEGYASSLHLKALAYINLDAAVAGFGEFRFSSSPLLKRLLAETVKEVSMSSELDTLKNEEVPFRLDDAAFPFLAYSGIPAVSFGFKTKSKEYPYLGTSEDHLDNLRKVLGSTDLSKVMRAAAEIAGRLALRLTHDHELYLDYKSYDNKLYEFISRIKQYFGSLKSIGLGLQWLYSARGDFARATAALANDIRNTDLNNQVASRALNDRIMKVEYHFLSPYVSPKDTPLRHIFFGSGSHTLEALMDHLSLLTNNKTAFDEVLFKKQLALATWTIQSAANALSGDIWDIDNEF